MPSTVLAAASREALGRHVEKTVQVDAHSYIEHASLQLDSRRPFQRLMQGVGGGQSVMHRIPVPELVGEMEMGHAQEGGVGHD